MQDLQRRLRNRPIYIWNSEKHKAASNPNNEIKGWCCFNHIIGLPTKNGIPQPLWDYQDMICQDTFIVTMGWSLSILTRTGYITLTNINQSPETVHFGTLTAVDIGECLTYHI